MQKTPVFQGTLNNSKFLSNGNSEKKPLPVKQITGYEEVISFSKTKLHFSDRYSKNNKRCPCGTR